MKEYFSHDFNARSNPKLVKVKMRLGHEGKSVFWDLIELLYEQDGYLILSECDSYAFALHTNSELVKTLIFEFDLFENDGVKFWSNSVLRRLDLRKEKSQKAAQSAKKRWSDANSMRTHNERNANAMQLKKRKVNKSKEEKEKDKKEKAATPHSLPNFSENENEENFNSIESEPFDLEEENEILYPPNPALPPQGLMIGKSKEKTETISQKKTTFVPPTENEVMQYFTEKTSVAGPLALQFAEKFCAYYEQRDWRIGKVKMKSWQMAVAKTWITSDDWQLKIQQAKGIQPKPQSEQPRQNAAAYQPYKPRNAG